MLKTRSLDLSVVIPTFNNVRYTAQCLASLARSAEGVNYEIIIADNGSTDETLSFVASHTPGQLRGAAQGEYPPCKVTVLHNEVPRALARSWNMGILASTAPHAIVSNNDVIYTPGSLKRLLEACKRSHVGISLPLSPQDITGIRPNIQQPVDVPTTLANIEEVERWDAKRPKTGEIVKIRHPYIRQGGYCWMVSKECYEKVGPIDEEYDLTGEDYDYFKRVLRWYDIVQVRDAYVEHFGKSTCAWLYDEYHQRLGRNRFRLAEKQDGQQEIVSVVLPTYNRIDSLYEAIESVRAQSYPHWKLYVVDDGSEDWDRVQTLANRYMGQHNEAGRIWFFHKPKREGPSSARNLGLELCRGKYVAFLDSDDIWYPNHLQTIIDTFETRDVEAVYTSPDFAWRWWDDRTKKFFYKRDTHPFLDYDGVYDAQLMQRRNIIQTSGFAMYGDTARSMRFDTAICTPTDGRVAEDWDFFKRVPGTIYHIQAKTIRYHHAKNPESEHMMDRITHLTGGSQGVETMQSVVIPHDIQETAQIGIVIPTIGRIESLERAIESVGYSDVPIVVIDDGSRNHWEVRAVVEKYPQCSLLMLYGNHGPSYARNRGSEYLPCTWLQMLDDDDVLMADWRARLSPYLADTVDTVIACSWVPCPKGGLFVEDDFYTSQLCIRRDTLLRVGGFDEGLRWAEERDLEGRLKAQGARIQHIKVPIVLRPMNGGSGDKRTEKRHSPQEMQTVPGIGDGRAVRRRF